MEKEGGGGELLFTTESISIHLSTWLCWRVGGSGWSVGFPLSTLPPYLYYCVCVFMLYLYARWENGEKHERVLMHEYSLPERNRDWNQSSS